jgi:hypothetical protein
VPIVERALDALPVAHQGLWLRAKDLVRDVARAHLREHRPMADLLVIVADGRSAWGSILRASEPRARESQGAVVAGLRGRARRAVLSTLGPSPPDYVAPSDRSFAVITAPVGSCPGFSWSSIVERCTLS